MTNIAAQAIGWIPLIVFWTMRFTLEVQPDWAIALPSFSIGVFVSLILSK